MKKTIIRLLFASCLMSLTLLASRAQADTPKKGLLVTTTYGFRHSSIETAQKVLTALGQKSGVYTLDIVDGGPRPNDKDKQAEWDQATRKALAEKMSPDALKNYDLVIFANTTGDLPLPDPNAFIDWIKNGGAFVGMHSASDTFHGFAPYIETLGGEFNYHQSQERVQPFIEDPEHPATKHFGKTFTVKDEIYIQKSFHRDQVHGLLSLDKHPNTGVPGDYPIAWCKQVGKGRVFYTELGHREDVWDPTWGQNGGRENAPEVAEAYQQHILGGIKWALGLEAGSAAPISRAAKLSADEAADGFHSLFDGLTMNGWHLRRTEGPASWSVQNGMLVNVVAPGKHGCDLVGDEKFWNFTVRYEYMIPKHSNSGFYLRGRHEIQIFDDFDRNEARPDGNGAIYNLSAASKFVTRKPGEWQQVEATMINDHVTVFLNGEKVQDNVLVDRATGSELDENVKDPGPFFLQGDHGSVAFRNIRVKPLK